MNLIKSTKYAFALDKAASNALRVQERTATWTAQASMPTHAYQAAILRAVSRMLRASRNP